MEIKILASSSHGNAYYLSNGETPILIEAGIRYKELQKRLGFKVSGLAACLISHEHKDHSMAVKDLLKAGVDCFASYGTWQALGLMPHHRILIASAKQQFQVGCWRVLPFDVEHDAEEPLGFLLSDGQNKVLYANDTYYLRYRVPGLTHVMVCCNYSRELLKENVEQGHVERELKNRLLRSHMSLETLKDFLVANDLSKVEAIWLLHLSDGNSDANQFQQEIEELTGVPTFIGERR